jgi:hypothetical protein
MPRGMQFAVAFLRPPNSPVSLIREFFCLLTLYHTQSGLWARCLTINSLPHKLGEIAFLISTLYHTHAVHPPYFPWVGLLVLFPAPAPPDKRLVLSSKCNFLFSSVILFLAQRCGAVWVFSARVARHISFHLAMARQAAVVGNL